MTSLTIDDDIGAQLLRRAEDHGRSMDEEAETILRDALRESFGPIGEVELDLPPRSRTGLDLANSIRAKFAQFGDVELDIPSRRSSRESPRFEE